MATRISGKLPEHFNLNASDEIAIKRGEQAAARIVRGAHLTDQLQVGDAISRLSRQAMAESGSNNRSGRPYNEAFGRLLDQHPKLRAVSGNMRTAAIWCIDNWPDCQLYLAGLDDDARQRMGSVRTLQAYVEREQRRAQRAEEPAVDEEPHPPRAPNEVDILRRQVRRLLDRDHRRAAADSKLGLAYDDESGKYALLSSEALRSWLEHVQNDEAELQKIAPLLEEIERLRDYGDQLGRDGDSGGDGARSGEGADDAGGPF